MIFLLGLIAWIVLPAALVHPAMIFVSVVTLGLYLEIMNGLEV